MTAVERLRKRAVVAGGGVPGVLLGSPRDDAGNLIMLGTGDQHWAMVHVADMAVAFRRVLQNDSALGRYIVGDGANLTVAELTSAAAAAVGAPGAAPAQKARPVLVWVTTSPRCCCSTRASPRPGPARSSAGNPRIPGWWRSSGTAATPVP